MEGRDVEGRKARTTPIKGTIACGQDPASDVLQKERLLGSEKDRAELAMIVDLERNDLGRISVPGGVRVGEFPRLETYRGLHHLVTDVVGEVRPECSAVDVVAALFPGGSITGAPKLRSMEAIAEIEGEGRGFFTGSLGFIDARGRATFNILIRTLIHRAAEGSDGEVSFHVGGGITWSSDPEARSLRRPIPGSGSRPGRSSPVPSVPLQPPPRSAAPPSGSLDRLSTSGSDRAVGRRAPLAPSVLGLRPGGATAPGPTGGSPAPRR